MQPITEDKGVLYLNTLLDIRVLKLKTTSLSMLVPLLSSGTTRQWAELVIFW